ncbi:MAG: histidine phosphatase family protein [Eubacteriales bacterium]|nr:histidine phosphatase family protein [Eubacteriales bacterium]
MKLILARHGQTEWNTRFRVQGRTDIPLNDMGRAQARALAERLDCMKIDAVYASPLERACESARCITERQKCPLIVDERLIERDFGAWEGAIMPELSKTQPALWDIWVKTPESCPIPGAETVQEVYARSMDFAAEALARHPDGNIVMISHANPVKLILCHYLQASPNCMHRIRTDNCSYSEIRRKEDDYVVSALNETYFLLQKGLLPERSHL